MTAFLALLPLQWGHGDEAVEDEEMDRMIRMEEHVLQWGHGDEAVEDISGMPG